MPRSILFALAVTTILAACASTEPVAGRMQRGDETFSGSITGSGYRGANGQLVLVSSNRTTCRGSFTFISKRRGDGVLNCDDGRSGPFHLAGAYGDGNGYGELSGQRFTFTFGPAS